MRALAAGKAARDVPAAARALEALNAAASDFCRDAVATRFENWPGPTKPRKKTDLRYAGSRSSRPPPGSSDRTRHSTEPEGNARKRAWQKWRELQSCFDEFCAQAEGRCERAFAAVGHEWAPMRTGPTNDVVVAPTERSTVPVPAHVVAAILGGLVILCCLMCCLRSIDRRCRGSDLRQRFESRRN